MRACCQSCAARARGESERDLESEREPDAAAGRAPTAGARCRDQKRRAAGRPAQARSRSCNHDTPPNCKMHWLPQMRRHGVTQEGGKSPRRAASLRREREGARSSLYRRATKGSGCSGPAGVLCGRPVDCCSRIGALGRANLLLLSNRRCGGRIAPQITQPPK